MYREKSRDSEFEHKVVEISRIARTVAGGKRIRFRALVVSGDRNGHVWIGLSKANDLSEAIKKATSQSKKEMISVPLKDGTIACSVYFKYGPAKIILRPAKKGKSIMAGSSVKTVLELAGIKNISAKILGSHNKLNNAKATYFALQQLKKYQGE